MPGPHFTWFIFESLVDVLTTLVTCRKMTDISIWSIVLYF